MRRFLFAFLLVFLADLGFAAQDSLVVEASAGNGFGALEKSAAGIWWPAKKASRKNSPVIVWFHGGMSSGNCQKGLVAGGDLSSMLPKYTVVSVSACRDKHWVTPLAAGWVDAALDSIAKRRGALVDQVSLVGISDGSLGVIAYSLWGKRRVDAHVLMSSYGASLGEASALSREPKLHSGRWRFIQGGSDRLYPAEATVPWIEGFCRGLLSFGVKNCDLKFDPAGEHDWSYWQKKQKKWILEFF